MAIHHVDPKDAHRNFAFKCHRESTDGRAGQPGACDIYAVRATRAETSVLAARRPSRSARRRPRRRAFWRTGVPENFTTARFVQTQVNAICFHHLGTFATAGSDGVFNFWDKDSKQRLMAFKKADRPISRAGRAGKKFDARRRLHEDDARRKGHLRRNLFFEFGHRRCSAFNPAGNLYAYALSYDWSRGSESHSPNAPNTIMLHKVQKDEITQRNKKPGRK